MKGLCLEFTSPCTIKYCINSSIIMVYTVHPSPFLFLFSFFGKNGNISFNGRNKNISQSNLSDKKERRTIKIKGKILVSSKLG